MGRLLDLHTEIEAEIQKLHTEFVLKCKQRDLIREALLLEDAGQYDVLEGEAAKEAVKNIRLSKRAKARYNKKEPPG